MANFEWNDRYSVNVMEIDLQHKKLFAMAHNLDEAMKKGQGKEVLGKLLNDLVYYTKTHFASEERIMETNHYPELDEHRRIHHKMTGKVEQIMKDFQDGNLRDSIGVMNFLQDWLTKHILGTDMKYSPYLNGRGVH